MKRSRFSEEQIIGILKEHQHYGDSAQITYRTPVPFVLFFSLSFCLRPSLRGF